MAFVFDVPTSLSPSRVEAFTSCPLAFRFASIEKLPEAPSIHTTAARSCTGRSSWPSPPAPERTPSSLPAPSPPPAPSTATVPTSPASASATSEIDAFDDECRTRRELPADGGPAAIHPIGLELRLERRGRHARAARHHRPARARATASWSSPTTRPAGRRRSTGSRSSLAGVHFYSFLCEQVLGRRPVAIRLMYLSSGETIEAAPSDQSTRFITTRTTAVWRPSSGRASTGDFRPARALCSSCSFQRGARRSAATPSRRGRGAARRCATPARDDAALVAAATAAASDTRPAASPIAVVDRFDAGPTTRLERLRGNPVADAVFTTASPLGDFSLDLAPRQRRPGSLTRAARPARSRRWPRCSAPRASSSTRASSACSAGPPDVEAIRGTRCAGR